MKHVALISLVFAVTVAGIFTAVSLRTHTTKRSVGVSLLVDGERCVVYPNGFDSDPIDPGFDIASERWAFKEYDATLHLYEKQYAFVPTGRGGSRTSASGPSRRPVVTIRSASLDSPTRLTEAGRAARPRRSSRSNDAEAIIAMMTEDEAFRSNPAYFETIPETREHALNFFAGQWPDEVAQIRTGSPPIRTYHASGLLFPAILFVAMIAASVVSTLVQRRTAKRRADALRELPDNPTP